MVIFETEHFVLKAPEKPHIDRKDGGHLVIFPKKKVSERQELSKEQRCELMELSNFAGQALKEALEKSGIKVGRVNYQDNGNWSVFKPEGPTLHLHIYGRAKDAKRQKYGEALYFPHPKENPDFYENLEPLDEKELEYIKKFLKENFKYD